MMCTGIPPLYGGCGGERVCPKEPTKGHDLKVHFVSWGLKICCISPRSAGRTRAPRSTARKSPLRGTGKTLKTKEPTKGHVFNSGELKTWDSPRNQRDCPKEPTKGHMLYIPAKRRQDQGPPKAPPEEAPCEAPAEHSKPKSPQKGTLLTLGN